MSVEDVLVSLGAKRTIWIDDFFNDGPERLAAMLLEEDDVTRTCGFAELAEPLRTFGSRPEASRERAVTALAEAGEARMREMKDAFFKARRELGKSGPELSSGAVDHVCNLLKVEREDRWHFDQAFASLPEVCGGDGDATVNYVVDLNDTMGSRTRGLDILIHLAALGSKGTAFILTHDAATVEEASKELEFRRKIEQDDPKLKRLSIPLCVIAKERLFGDPNAADIEDVLSVALKRAGLRRSVHEVLWRAEDSLAEAFQDAAARLTEIAPEQLESYVVERGYREGVSELHVVERALTAHMAKTLRGMFGIDEAVKHSAMRMRALRDIKLVSAAAPHDERLVAFRNAETWEEADLINASHAPIASGDVFELDVDDLPNRGLAKRRFVLIAQACEIGLRPTSKRGTRTGILLPLKAALKPEEKTGAKQYVLQCTLDGVTPVVDLRNPATVDLSIMDLASFRSDGAVRYDKGQDCPSGLLPGQAGIYDDRTAWLAAYIEASEEKAAHTAAAKAKAKALSKARPPARVAEPEPSPPAATGIPDAAHIGPATDSAPVMPEAAAVPDGPVPPTAASGGGTVEAAGEPRDLHAEMEAALAKLSDAYEQQASSHGAVARRLQLAVASPEEFKHVAVGAFEPSKAEKGRPPHVPARVTWRLIRRGRIREPFAADILSNYLASIGRNAFEIDYLLTAGAPTQQGQNAAEGSENSAVAIA